MNNFFGEVILRYGHKNQNAIWGKPVVMIKLYWAVERKI